MFEEIIFIFVTCIKNFGNLFKRKNKLSQLDTIMGQAGWLAGNHYKIPKFGRRITILRGNDNGFTIDSYNKLKSDLLLAGITIHECLNFKKDLKKWTKLDQIFNSDIKRPLETNITNILDSQYSTWPLNTTSTLLIDMKNNKTPIIQVGLYAYQSFVYSCCTTQHTLLSNIVDTVTNKLPNSYKINNKNIKIAVKFIVK